MDEDHAEDFGAEHGAGQSLVEGTVREWLLRDGGERARNGSHQPHGPGQLRLGPEQLLGVDEGEQLRRLIPAGFRDVHLNFADNGEQRR